MYINKILNEKNMTRYRLAKESGLPQTTVTDICIGKAKIENCTGETLYKIAKTLGVTIESLLYERMEYRESFETFKSNVCHMVKDMGDFDFLIKTIESDSIFQYLERHWYPEALYLLAMVDYLFRENNLPLYEEYEDLRHMKLKEVVYPAGILVLSAVTGSDEPKKISLKESIPEFLRHNIVESEVRNIA